MGMFSEKSNLVNTQSNDFKAATTNMSKELKEEMNKCPNDNHKKKHK